MIVAKISRIVCLYKDGGNVVEIFIARSPIYARMTIMSYFMAFMVKETVFRLILQSVLQIVYFELFRSSKTTLYKLFLFQF